MFEVAPAFRPPGLGCWADSPDVAGRRKEIARRYSWMAEQRRGRLSHDQKICLIRMRELERIYEARYGRCLPDDDAGRDAAEIMAHHIAHRRGEVSAHIRNWLRMWAPWMSGADVAALIARVSAGPLKFTADQLGVHLRLTMKERTDLRITTIGCHDFTKAERAELRKTKKGAGRARKTPPAGGASGPQASSQARQAFQEGNSCTAGRCLNAVHEFFARRLWTG